MIQSNRAACVDWQNRGAVSDLRSLELRSAFLAELPNGQGSEKQTDDPCDLRVLVERTPTQYVFAAKISSGQVKRVLIEQVARIDVSPSALSRSALRLRKELLWQQSGRVLDAVQVDGVEGRSPGFLILALDGVSLYEMESTQSRLRRSWPLGGVAAERRAPRGELILQPSAANSVRIVLPGKVCEMNLDDAATPVCRSGAEPWRTEARLSSKCDSVAWGLRTDTSDWSATDRVVLFDASAPRAHAPLGEISVPGPVLSLSAGGSGATAVVFNLTTGNYEVYALALDCAN